MAQVTRPAPGTQAGSCGKPRCAAATRDSRPARPGDREQSLVGVWRRPRPAVPATGRGCVTDDILGETAATIESPIPISATVTSPHSRLPGINTCPGLRRQNVTVAPGPVTRPRPGPFRYRPSTPAWHVDGYNGRANSSDEGGKGRIEVACKTGAEKGVNHEVCIACACFGHRCGFTRPHILRPFGGRRLSWLQAAVRRHGRATPRSARIPRRDKAIAAVPFPPGPARTTTLPGRQALSLWLRATAAAASACHEYVLGKSRRTPRGDQPPAFPQS